MQPFHRQRALTSLVLLGLVGLGACDRTPPSQDEMRQALQAAIDAEVATGASSTRNLNIARFETQNCEFTAMVGKPVYRCDVALAFGPSESPGPLLKSKPVMFHKSAAGWIVPN